MDVVMPQLGETVTEGTITVWHRKVGDTVSASEILFEVSTDKVDTEIPAPADGVLTEVLVQEGATVDVGVRLAVIDDGKGDVAVKAEPETAPEPSVAAAPSGAMAGLLSPVVSRLIAEHGLDATAIVGSGRDGRITRRDVLAHLETLDTEPAGDGELLPFSRINRLTAEHMVRSTATSAHVLQAVEVDFATVDQVRAAAGDAWKTREGFALTYLPFIARAVCLAIAEFPNVNASVEGDGLRVHRRINLAIAVDRDRTELVAPVIKHAGGRSVAELARAIHDLATRVRGGKLTPDDLAEGTYTISNNGSFGTLFTGAIINQPQIAILSVDGIKKRPVVVEGPGGDDIVIRPMGILGQSFDHRAMGGAYSGAYLRRLTEILQTRDWSAELD
jgi:2-oxoglutarate dehydrogenase E2 component (dihydrolipoamide succinyltransferase)